MRLGYYVELSGRSYTVGLITTDSFGRFTIPVMHAVLRGEPATDAIFCGSDQIARGAADALRDAGRRIPDDIALVGYDNWDVFAPTCRPPLTTVDMCLEELGRSRRASCSP